MHMLTSLIEFVEILNEMRRGTMSSLAISIFKSLSRPIPPGPLSVAPTELFPLRQEVTRSNLARLSALTTPLYDFKSRDTGSAGPDQKKKLLDGMMAVEELRVKEGAQVMLIKNLGEGSCPNVAVGGTISMGSGLVNGSVGVVVGFRRLADVSGETSSNCNGSGTGHVRNVKVGEGGSAPEPLKKEGKPSEDKENQPRADGVALEVKATAKGKAKEISEELFPLVRFPTTQGSETVLLMREEFRIEDNEGKLLARRMQVRLLSLISGTLDVLSDG